MTDEQRAKLSAANIGRNKGVPRSAETKAKISASHMGLKASPEARANLSAAIMGHPGWNKGQKMSPETRAKMSAAQMGHVCSEAQRKQISATETGKKALFTPETRARISAALWKGGRKASRARWKAKRRTFGFAPLNAPFTGCEGHHVDNEQVIYIPKALHRSIFHRQSDGRGMAQMNALAYNFLFKQEVEAAFEAFDANVKAA